MDACASLWLEGEFVHLEDLVLHDAQMDIRSPTHELARARTVLRARRRISTLKMAWPPSAGSIAELVGRQVFKAEGDIPSAERELDEYRDGKGRESGTFDPAFGEIDAVVIRSSRTLELADCGSYLVYDEDWDERTRISDWMRVAAEVETLPPTIAAAILDDAWNAIDPLQHAAGMGRLMAPALLKFRKKTINHLSLLNVGLRTIPRELRRSRDPTVRLIAFLNAVAAAADEGLRNHETWTAAKMLLERKLKGRRSTSKLPGLIDLLLEKPLVSTGMIAIALKVSNRAAQDLIVELGVREITGRGRFRAWGIL